ncbi:S41 family peptidase [Vagococcus sp. DIV0080]|uniref:S41 family peptidase n=1 Tax=Candidatus Vagococcus giribetii TaxID=2230876 RepID=A0ABS3HU32_9ENTE|nr:S41 family peptidase [Vagococcus sp. DIV0080]MBO0476855.1 S41 family peptidase [Vagococcus sp. DIV0080]
MPQKNSKKISIFQYVVTIVVVGILASGLTLFIYELNGPRTSSHMSNAVKDDLENISYLYELIDSQYIEDVSETDLVNGALKGMTEAIGDPHSVFFPEEAAKDFDDSVSGSFEGIGASMMLENEYPVIAEPPFEDSPAQKAKLKKGDIITKVDGKEVKGQPLNEVVSKIKGEKGTKVTLEIMRGNESFSVDIIRDTIPVKSVKSNIDKTNKDVGYIQITSFNETTSDEFDEAVSSLRKEGAKRFIVDVRGNPGGVLQNVEKMTSRFLNDGDVIVGFEDKNKETFEEVAGKKFDKGEKINEPTVLLMDENSASASEIMAGALKAHGFDVIGTTSYGKGTVQTLVPIEGHGEVKLTISKWLTPDGKWIHEKGVEPTIKVDYPDYLKRVVIDRSMTYEEGVISNHVETINTYLNELGYNVGKVSSTYTADTTKAIKEFQTASGIEATGKADKATVEALETAITQHWKENDIQYETALKTVLSK